MYHLEVAGRLLETSLVPVYPDRLAPEQIVNAAELQVATEHLREAVRLDPRNVQAMRLLARAHLSLGEPEAALQVLQAALVVRPQHRLLRLELADVYDTLGYTEDALREYESGGIGSRNAPVVANYLKMADTQVAIGSGDVAIGLWYKVLAIDPNNLYALYRLYRIHRELGDLKHAAIYQERLSTIDPQTVTVPLDFRLAEYQARAMIALVEEGIWRRDKLLAAVSSQVQQSDQDLLRFLMVEHLIKVLLDCWPDDPDLLACLADWYHRRESQ
ncbi:MAG: tetratricopeptide repeat protein [Anaerolineae bacterium]